MTPLARIGPRLDPPPPSVEFVRPPRSELWAFFAGMLTAAAFLYAWVTLG
jgi:hypothetical protein